MSNNKRIGSKSFFCFLLPSSLSLNSKTSRKRLSVQNVFRFLPLFRGKALKGMSNGSVMVPLLRPLLHSPPPCIAMFVIPRTFQHEPTISICVKRMNLPSQVLSTLCSLLMVCWKMSSSNWMSMKSISSAFLNNFPFQRPFLPFSQAKNLVAASTSFLELEMPITFLKKSSSKRF